MGSRYQDISGEVFGYLTALAYVRTTQNASRGAVWRFKCVCGGVTEKAASDVKRTARKGVPPCCGCMTLEKKRETQVTHGLHKSPIYRAWGRMKSRCDNPGNASYGSYGERGITYDPAWREFEVFYRDMAESWAGGLSLDRIDNSAGYSKENCRWATPTQQANNRRSNYLITTPQGEMTVAEAARAYGLRSGVLRKRLKLGWGTLAALTTPLREQGTRYGK